MALASEKNVSKVPKGLEAGRKILFSRPDGISRVEEFVRPYIGPTRAQINFYFGRHCQKKEKLSE